MNTQIYEEASDWFVNHRAGDMGAEARRKFDAWLRASPQHVAAYLEIAAVWNEGPALEPDNAIDVKALLERALTESDNVVPLPVAALLHGPNRSLGSSTSAHSYTRQLALAVSLFIVTGVFGWMYTQRGVFATDVGEQRLVQLADGSTVDLNTRSRIRVRYADDERLVELLEGEALFRVAKDAARPFIVEDDKTSVQAVGTQFDVYRRESGTTVTVLEGRVTVLSPLAKSEGAAYTHGPQMPKTAAVYLAAGEQVDIKQGVATQARPANLDVATAWTKRQLVFESANLEEVAEEFNRYNERRLVIRDTGSKDFHISGVFSSADPASLIRFLRERRGIQVQETAKEIYIARK